MKPEEAERIVNEYGGVIEKAALSWGFAWPVSMLPNDKATIKLAIIIYMAVLKVASQLDESFRGSLGCGYMYLARFVEDEWAQRVRDWQQATLRATPTDWSQSALLSENSEQCLEMCQAICDEEDVLLVELREFEKSIGLKLHYSDDPDEAKALAMEDVRKRFGLTQPASAEPPTKCRRIRWKFWRR